MADKIFFHVYSSRASNPFSPDALLELLNQSRAANAQAGLTGMLLYRNGDFMQALEGPETAVKATMLRIRRDFRHHSVTKLVEGTYDERQFAGWHMAFRDLETPEAKATPGFSDYLNTPLAVGLAADPSICQKLLHIFKEKIR